MKLPTAKNTSSMLTYSIGFILSLLFTLAAYFLVINNTLSTNALVAVIVVLALGQLVTQLVFFLHLGEEQRPRWNLYVLLFAVLVIVIIVFGSLWIMYNLDYHHGDHSLTPQQKELEIIKDEGFEQHRH